LNIWYYERDEYGNNPQQVEDTHGHTSKFNWQHPPILKHEIRDIRSTLSSRSIP
jgi:hypothetical protein